MHQLLTRVRRQRRWMIALLVLGVAICSGCSGGGGGGSESTRSFAMGFTPWPYAGTLAAVGDTYTKIQTHGDMVNHHFDGGVPWPEAFAGQAACHADLEGDLPIVIAETGWIAEDLDIPFYGVHIPGSAAWQADYVQTLLAEADRLDALFVTWFSVVDFDTLWYGPLAQDPLAQIWRDTGLYDQDVLPRAALSVWDGWLARPIR